MSIKFKPVARKDPRDQAAPAKFYASAVAQGKTDIDQLAAIIARESTVSRSDTYAVIMAALETIINELQSGRSVYLSKLGSLSVSLSSDGAETADDLGASHIKGAKIIYRPGAELKSMLKTLKYVKTE